MLAPSILASVTNSRRFDILDPSLNAIEQLPFAAHCALLGCPPCLRPPVHHVSGTYSPRRLARRRLAAEPPNPQNSLLTRHPCKPPIRRRGRAPIQPAGTPALRRSHMIF